MIALMEKETGLTAKIKTEEAIKADMDVTWADISKAKKILGWEPKISFEEGIKRLMAWHKLN